ncbi:MAG: AIR synthase-related protein [Candidatus Brocadiia bacterium]
MASSLRNSSFYERLGASASKGEVHRAIVSLPPSLYEGAFCRILPDLFAADPAMCVISHCDGAGTKPIVAYLYYREKGDASAMKGLATDAVVMNVDDMMCAGARGPFVLSNTILRNKHLIGEDAIRALVEGYVEFAAMIEKLGIVVHLAGGETADMGDSVRTLCIEATVTCRMPRAHVIDNDRIAAGDVIIGLSSEGTASYDSVPNSGIGCNGLSLARNRVLAKVYSARFPEICDPEAPSALSYAGALSLDSPLPGSNFTVGQALLSPTRTYSPVIKAVLNEIGPDVHGLVHCTGGGQTKCIRFGRGIHFVKDNLFPAPAIFKYIRDCVQPHIPWREMYEVFNMGHRLEIVVPPQKAEAVRAISEGFGVASQVIGHCEASPNSANSIAMHTPDGIERFD